MTKPSLKEKLNNQRAANATSSTPVGETFRQDREGEPRVRTSMYLPESLARQLKIAAAVQGVRANDLVISALTSYLDDASAP